MKLRGEDDARIITWLQRKMDRYMQNEILKIMALLILRGVVNMISIAPFLTTMIDEMCNVSNREHIVICFRWVDQSLETHEDFIGVYQVESTESEMLIAMTYYTDSTYLSQSLEDNAMTELQQCPYHGEEWLLGFSGTSLGLVVLKT